ncbi:MAG: GNAT family N-acetyltransferase [Hyphomicrobiaceae bacterium]
MTNSDTADIAALHAVIFDPPWGSDAIARMVEDGGDCSLVARGGVGADGERLLLGFVIARSLGDEIEIVSLGVKPAMQRRGIAGHLLAHLARSEVGKNGRIVLEVAVDNMPARALYARFGFSEVGRRKNYYGRQTGSSVDALVLAGERADILQRE